MTNQRPGKYQKSAASSSGEMIKLTDLYLWVKQAQAALEREHKVCDEALEQGYEDSALRFELFADYLLNKPANEPFEFKTVQIGL